MSIDEVLNEIYDAILSYDVDRAINAAKMALKIGLNPILFIKRANMAIKEVGTKFGDAEIFLVQLVIAAEAMKEVMKILSQEIKRRKAKIEAIGKVVIGTVEGDIHEIGKNLVATMLAVNGYEVIDLGKDVPSEVFISKIREHKPDILALSALMTTTIINQDEVIKRLEEETLRDKVKVLVGGAPVTARWAEKIGADGYALDAMEVVDIVKRMLNV